MRIDTPIDDNLMLAQRIAQQKVLAKAVDLDRPDVKILGYRRIIHSELSRGDVRAVHRPPRIGCIASAS